MSSPQGGAGGWVAEGVVGEGDEGGELGGGEDGGEEGAAVSLEGGAWGHVVGDCTGL